MFQDRRDIFQRSRAHGLPGCWYLLTNRLLTPKISMFLFVLRKGKKDVANKFNSLKQVRQLGHQAFLSDGLTEAKALFSLIELKSTPS